MAITFSGRFDKSNGLVGTHPRAAYPILSGTRPYPFDPKSTNKGEQVATAKNRARYTDLQARNFGNGLVRVSSDASGVVIEDVDAYNFYRLIEGDKGCSLTDFTVRRIHARGFERSIARLRGKSGPGVFEDIEADSERQIGDPFTVGFHLSEECHDIEFRRVKVRDCWGAEVSGRYRQGDGFSDERGCARIAYIDTLADNCTDGGYDLKSTDMRGANMTARHCGRSFRLWGSGTIGLMTSENPRGGHISLHGGSRPSYVIDMLRVRSTKTADVFMIDAPGGADLVIKDHDIQVPAGSWLVRSGQANKITWGKPPPKTVKGLTV